MRILLDREFSERVKRWSCGSYKPVIAVRPQEVDQEQRCDQWTPFVLGLEAHPAPAAWVTGSLNSRSLLKAG